MSKKTNFLFTSVMFLLLVTTKGFSIDKLDEKINEPDFSNLFIDPNQILEIWERNYANFDSMKISCTEKIIEMIPPEEDPNLYDGIVKLMHIERIEQQERFWTRYSTSIEGFNEPNSIFSGSFDGKTTNEYVASSNSGMIINGMIGRNTENNNELKRYMLLNKRLVVRENAESPFKTYLIEDPNTQTEFYRIINNGIQSKTIKLLPEKESVAGETCCVLEISDNYSTRKFWIAYEKGMLPLKYQTFNNNVIIIDITVEQIDSVRTEQGIIWYPKKATRTSSIQNRGKLKYELTIHEFVPNIEVSDKTFRLVFPPGTMIHDYNANIYYRAEDKSSYDKSFIGKALPDFDNIQFNSNPDNLSSKKILVCFFDFEQRLSRRNIIQLQETSQTLRENDIEIIAVQTSNMNKVDLDEWIKENNIKFPVGTIKANPTSSPGTDEEQIRINWGVKSLPWCLLTDREHIVKSEGFNLDELDNELKKTEL